MSNPTARERVTYRHAGVDVSVASQWARKIRKFAQTTHNPGTIGDIGGFGALFDGRFSSYQHPILVSSTDGVGTKLKIAQLVNRHDTVGIDLVAMNVNDILCCGANPLFFLDYIACGKLKPEVLSEVVKGIAAGCHQSGCALIGGETAQMAGMYEPSEYDLAGFVVGVVERSKLIDGRQIHPGDQLMGLASSGLHSNGFSLVRKVLSVKEQKRLADELLCPTRIYVKPVLKLLLKLRTTPPDSIPVHGIAHITGGSFHEKLGRILPKGVSAHIYKDSWKVPSIFQHLQSTGVPEEEMYRTFNMGIGMVLVVSSSRVKEIQQVLKKEKITCWTIGHIQRGNGEVCISPTV